MLNDDQKQELNKIKENYNVYIDSLNSKSYKDYKNIKEKYLKIFYDVIINWAKENNVNAFCTAWYFKLPEKYTEFKFFVDKVALWNNKGTIQNKIAWLNKVSIESKNGRYTFPCQYKICKHRVTTDKEMLEPFATNFCLFIEDIVNYLNEDNDFSKYSIKIGE